MDKAHDIIVYFLSLCKTYKPDYNRDNLPARRYEIKETLSYNGFSVELDLEINITANYIYQLKTIKINDKNTNLNELKKLLKGKCTIAPLPPLTQIWY